MKQPLTTVDTPVGGKQTNLNFYISMTFKYRPYKGINSRCYSIGALKFAILLYNFLQI